MHSRIETAGIKNGCRARISAVVGGSAVRFVESRQRAVLVSVLVEIGGVEPRFKPLAAVRPLLDGDCKPCRITAPTFVVGGVDERPLVTESQAFRCLP